MPVTSKLCPQSGNKVLKHAFVVPPYRNGQEPAFATGEVSSRVLIPRPFFVTPNATKRLSIVTVVMGNIRRHTTQCHRSRGAQRNG